MPFQDEFFEVYEMLKINFADRFEFSNAGDEENQQNILKDIIQPIYEADVVIADLTGLNANVMYDYKACRKGAEVETREAEREDIEFKVID